MPADLRRHIRYPLDIFGVQTAVYSTYHMEDPQSFYNREDQWEIPVMGAEGRREAMEPYYTIKAQRDGNWALYGEESGKLGEIIGKMR